MKLIKCFQKNGSVVLNNIEQLLIDFIGRRIEMFLENFDSRISSYNHPSLSTLLNEIN